MCMFLPTTCVSCMKKHGSIYPYDAVFRVLHENCKCKLVPMRSKQAGTATKAKEAGVDAYLKHTGKLPNNYITKKEVRKLGWEPLTGNLSEVLPGKSIGGSVYNNYDWKLPSRSERIWYEADFDYIFGYRNDCRILYSSDGLIFVSYDHYKTFYEIT